MDEQTIRTWWERWPDANVGIATGAVSGLIVLDVDPRHGGDEGLATLEREHGPLPDTVESRTGGGGRHLGFAYPGAPIRNRVSFVRGLDVRADGGHIVAPPASHASGDQYAWVKPPETAPLAAIPDWLLQRLLDGDGARGGAPGGGCGQWAAELPPDWDERLVRDPILAGYWSKTRTLRGPDDSMSAYALAIANRLVREYRDIEEHILGVLDAFYRHHGRTKPWAALVLTLRKARGAPSDAAEEMDRDTHGPRGDEDQNDDSRGATHGDGQGDGSNGHADECPSPSLSDLLSAVEALLRRYIVFPSEAQAVAVVLWIAHAHAIAAFNVTPYLSVTSAEKRSGKSRLLEVLARLVPRAWSVVLPTEAVVYRRIERDCPTLLLDEVDTVFNARSDVEGLRALLNAGNRREAVVTRCQGKAQKLVDFRVFCPKVLAGIGALPDTVADRSIPIRLARRKATERVVRLRARDVEAEGAPLNAALALWADKAMGVLSSAEPELPSALNDRAADAWEPLLAIADVAGGDWPSRARAAAIRLHGKESDEVTDGITLLRAIHEVFAERPIDRILTVDLLRALVARETEPWAVWWGQALGRDETQAPAAKLARLLKPYDIIPKTIRVGERRGKGYERADFADAFERYVPPEEEA